MSRADRRREWRNSWSKLRGKPGPRSVRRALWRGEKTTPVTQRAELPKKKREKWPEIAHYQVQQADIANELARRGRRAFLRKHGEYMLRVITRFARKLSAVPA